MELDVRLLLLPAERLGERAGDQAPVLTHGCQLFRVEQQVREDTRDGLVRGLASGSEQQAAEGLALHGDGPHRLQ